MFDQQPQSHIYLIFKSSGRDKMLTFEKVEPED